MKTNYFGLALRKLVLFIQCLKLVMFLQYCWMALCFLFMILVAITFVRL